MLVTELATAPDDILQRICRENLAVYRESPARLQEDVSQESQVGHDYRGRLVYELLQNADDALLGEVITENRARFLLTENELWVANTGRPFTEADVRGLCGLGASSKTQVDGPKRASIGHKGLGFKSILEITDAPEAFSETVCFRLSRGQALEQVGALWAELDRGYVRGVPVMRFPTAITADHPVWRGFREDGFHSAFRFPFHAKVTSDQRAALAYQLLTLPMTSVLFLKHLEEVVIDVQTSAEQEGRQWLLERYRMTSAGAKPCEGMIESGLYRVDLVNQSDVGERYWVAHNSEVLIGEHRDGLAGPAWDGVDISEVSVAVRDAGDPRIEPESRRFHVFLPTQEPSGCSVLVNGAFTTDLSRKHVQVSDAASNYNAHLVRQSAQTFVETLVPHLLTERGPRCVLRALEQEAGIAGEAALLMRAALTDALADAPLLPAGDSRLSLSEAVLPTPVLGAHGPDFAALLRTGSSVGGRRFPDPQYCEGELATVCVTYGAVALSPVGTLNALAEAGDPVRTVLRQGPAGRFRVDPVLDLCATLWENADADDRQELQATARRVAVFPIGEDAGGTVNRIALGDESAFYPPRSSAEDLPLRRLRFLAHAVCWGTLGRTEQRSVLEHRMRAWDALFDIKEFRFEEVMRAAVLPGLTRMGSVDVQLRDSNRTIEALAAICRLAGKTTKPDQPLPMGRLGSDRAFFNLSRLEVPCRSEPGSELHWAPAHKVYFGRDWVGTDSAEEIADALAAAGKPMDIHFLAAPRVFDAYSSAIGVHVDRDDVGPATAADDGEVDLEDDTDEVLETTAVDRWRNFFAWLGVSRGLRLVPFHDVVDSGTGWTSTKGLGVPGGWAFAGLGGAWSEFRQEIERNLSGDPRWGSTDHYLYELHNLDKFDEIAAVSRLKDNDVAEKLLMHLVRNWATYARHTRATLALIGAGKYPSARTAPPRAASEELVTATPNLWLFRLRNHPICPTSHGPRRPDQTWRRSEELLRRLGRGGRAADVFLPVLRQPADVSSSALRACLDELQVRGELTPAAFTIEDAHDLCVRMSELYAGAVTGQVLRSELRPIYRQMFELLVGSVTTRDTQLSETPLAASTADGIEFRPARDVVYASVSGSRERSGVKGKVPLFVLEAEPGALAPLRNIFGTPLLEGTLEWSVMPGESALEGADLEEFRRGLRELVPPLLARLGADRAERSGADGRALLEFAERIEPVEALALGCSFRGKDLGEIPPRSYSVRRTNNSGFQGFAVWTGPPWPPIAEDAQTLAMALAETLEVNTVETFLSFINATPSQRQQLLDLAGAAERLEEVTHELAGAAADETSDSAGSETAEVDQPAPTDGESTETTDAEGARFAPLNTASHAATPVPLHRFEDLLLDGQVIRVEGVAPSGASNGKEHGGVSGGLGGQTGSADGVPRAAAGTDLAELDRLGMRITFAFESRRFDGMKSVVLPGDETPVDADVLIVDASTPKMIAAAMEQSNDVKAVFNKMAEQGISQLHPGFDILTIKGGQVDRMIELKSSGVDAHVQAMSWNEWKTAQGQLRSHFWLYLVGNLRADLHNSVPFVRTVQDPFGTLASSKNEDTIRRRTVQLRVREFPSADQLTLEIRRKDAEGLSTR